MVYRRKTTPNETKDRLPTDEQRVCLELPQDITRELRRDAREWIEQYQISPHTITKNLLFWSEQREYLVFPYYITGELVGWQGRYFGKEKKPKWFSQGKLDTFVYTLGKDSDTIILTEDIVSAIKISSLQKSSPIFGSVISNHRFIALTHICENVIIWLDPDKQKEAITFANKGRLFGLNCSVILSEKDPKEHTYEEIQRLINK